MEYHNGHILWAIKIHIAELQVIPVTYKTNQSFGQSIVINIAFLTWTQDSPDNISSLIVIIVVCPCTVPFPTDRLTIVMPNHIIFPESMFESQ